MPLPERRCRHHVRSNPTRREEEWLELESKALREGPSQLQPVDSKLRMYTEKPRRAQATAMSRPATRRPFETRPHNVSSIRSSPTARVAGGGDIQRQHPAVQFHVQHAEGDGKLSRSNAPRAARGQETNKKNTATAGDKSIAKSG